MTTLLSPPPAPASRATGAGGGGRRGRRRPSQARRTPRGRRILRLAQSRWTRFGLPLLVVLLALVAAGALEFPALSNWWAGHRQHELAAQLDDPAIAGQMADGTLADGKPIGNIAIKAIGLDMVVVQGVDASDLAAGPGHYPGTPMPCTAGDVAIAGHRTTFLHPFYKLNDLKVGDVVKLSTPEWSCSYTVSSPPFSVLPTDTSVVGATPGQYTLTLTTCNPIGSASHRLVVKAVMVTSSLHSTPAPTSKSVHSQTSRGSSNKKN